MAHINTGPSCLQKEGFRGFFASNISTPKDLRLLASSPVVDTIHVSSKSDAFGGNTSSYAGLIIYSCDGRSQWQTANGTLCTSGYLVIMDTEGEKIRMNQQQSPARIHHAIYRIAFGEQCTERNLDAESFSVIDGMFEINSGVFNPTEDGFNGSKRSAHSLLTQCIKKVVKYWMNAGERFHLCCRDHNVKDLLRVADSTVSPVCTGTPLPAVVPSLKALAARAMMKALGKQLDGCSVE